jgi:hypothetical protein
MLSLSKHLFFATLRGVAKEKPTSRLLAHRGGTVCRGGPVRRSPSRLWRRPRRVNFSEGGFGDDLKWLRDLAEDKPESRDVTPMPQKQIRLPASVILWPNKLRCNA